MITHSPISHRGRADILALTKSGLEELAAKAIPDAAASADIVYSSVFKTGRLDPAALGMGAAKASAWANAFRLSHLFPKRVVEERSELGTTAKARGRPPPPRPPSLGAPQALGQPQRSLGRAALSHHADR